MAQRTKSTPSLEDRAAVLLDQAANGEPVDTNEVGRVAWAMPSMDRELFMRALHDAQIRALKVPT